MTDIMNDKEYNTWKIKVGIDNVRENYEASRNVPKATLNSDVKLMNWLKQRTYPDKVSFNKNMLDLNDIRETIKNNQE